jgi:Toprim domain
MVGTTDKSSLTAQQVAQAIAAKTGGGVEPTGGGFRVRCLVHGGVDRNLSLRDGDARLLVRCYSHGCDPIEILRAIRELTGGRSAAYRPPLGAHNDKGAPGEHSAKRLELALWLWRRRRRPEDTIVERYLVETRGCGGLIPPTIGSLAAYKDYPPSLIAAFGLPLEPEPGVLEMPDSAVRGVQLIGLTADARKAGKPTTIGHCLGSPIVVAPMNDLLGLSITEGLEDALSIHLATGFGAWAAGGASRFAALAPTVPHYTDWVSIYEDDDPAGVGSSALLARLLAERKPEVERVRLQRPAASHG